jgi:peptidoglycan/xylan/chitin deacetylase (PgdA/CDA1 family)
MCEPSDNRAVSALFRVFGGGGRRCCAEACLHTGFRGMHGVEHAMLAVWIPLSVWVATAGYLCAWVGTTVGILLAFPLGFLVINLLPCALGGRTPAAQWRMWLVAFLVWAAFSRNQGGVTAGFAWAWIGLAVLNLAAFLLLVMQRSMEMTGGFAIVWRVVLLVAAHLLAVAAGWHWGWVWAIAGGACIAGVYCWAVLRPGCQWLGPVTCRTGDRGVLITIDDGPDPHDTPRLLDLLDEHQVKAVFFMIGEKVAAHPELAREVVRRGHAIGNHTMSHPQATFWCAGPWRTRREISECQRVIKETTGVAPEWFRAPVGHRNLFTHPVAAMLGMKVMAWNRRGFDAVEKDAGKVLARVLTGLGPGDIVLMHEGTPIASEVLRGILEHFRKWRLAERGGDL